MKAIDKFIQIDGATYACTLRGQGDPLVLLHGFTGSRKTWDVLVENWLTHFQVITIDLPGHGQTKNASKHTMEQFCHDLYQILKKLNIEQPHILGYSMGGRAALSYAMLYPDDVKTLTLESASPGLKTEAERMKRMESDANLAERIKTQGIEQFVSFWENIPLFETQKRLSKEVQASIRQERLNQSESGLANSLLSMGTGKQPSWWSKLHKIHIPVHLIVGALDSKFVQINEEMATKIEKATWTIVQHAGHTVHVEQAEKFVRIVLMFLKQKIQKEVQMMTVQWEKVRDYEEIIFEKYNGIAKITMNRPERHNAFTPLTVNEMIDAFARARDDSSVGVIILTGKGDKAFCSGGDQAVRGHGGYVGEDEIPRLNVLDLQRLIRTIPKPVIAMVNGYAIGGGHVLHVVCDLTIASENATFGQTGPKVGSFDAGYGAGYLARMIGHKRAREIWYLCRQYSAAEAYEMGMVNTVVPLEKLEAETLQWCEEILEKSPTALRFLKASFNADTDGLAGLQQLGGDATLLYYTTEEAKEGRDAFEEKRKPDFDQFPRFP